MTPSASELGLMSPKPAMDETLFMELLGTRSQMAGLAATN